MLKMANSAEYKLGYSTIIKLSNECGSDTDKFVEQVLEMSTMLNVYNTLTMNSIEVTKESYSNFIEGMCLYITNSNIINEKISKLYYTLIDCIYNDIRVKGWGL